MGLSMQISKQKNKNETKLDFFPPQDTWDKFIHNAGFLPNSLLWELDSQISPRSNPRINCDHFIPIINFVKDALLALVSMPTFRNL